MPPGAGLKCDPYSIRIACPALLVITRKISYSRAIRRGANAFRREDALRNISFLTACFLALFAAGSARAQQSAPASIDDKRAEQATPGAASGDEKRDVKTYTLSPEEYERAVTYSAAMYRLHFIRIAYSLLLLFMILRLGVSATFRNAAETLTRRRYAQAVIFVPLIFILYNAMRLPLDAYVQHLALKYDMSIQGWGSWLRDWTKGKLVSTAMATVVVYFFYEVVRRSPRRWWLYSGLAVLPLLAFFNFLAPIVLQPIFNKFEPLSKNNPALVQEIEKLATRGQLEIPRERMFEMKASEKLRSLNAYVAGFGASKRIVVWDTTVENMTQPQALFVIGHEMGHYVLGHISKSIAFASVVTLLILYLVYRSINWPLERWGKRRGLRGIEDWASLPALMFLFLLFVFLAEPVTNSFSRYQEHEADVYGLEVTHGVVPDSRQAAAEAFQILGELDLADPQPSAFIKIWLYSHPPLAERLEFASGYDPWAKGEPTRFVPSAGLTGQ